MIYQAIETLAAQPSGLRLFWNGYRRTIAGNVHTATVLGVKGSDLGEIEIHAMRRAPGAVGRVVFTSCAPPSGEAATMIEMAAGRLLVRACHLIARFDRQTERRNQARSKLAGARLQLADIEAEIETLGTLIADLGIPSLDE